MTSADAVFLDTNVLVAASVVEHPSHAVAEALVGRLAAGGCAVCVSPQVCREFIATMTRAMLASRVGRLATLDQGDFRRYEDAIALEPITT